MSTDAQCIFYSIFIGQILTVVIWNYRFIFVLRGMLACLHFFFEKYDMFFNVDLKINHIQGIIHWWSLVDFSYEKQEEPSVYITVYIYRPFSTDLFS